MSTPPYPIIPQPMEKSWLDRHPRWKIPAGFLTLILLIVVFGGIVMLIVMASFHGSDVYKQAVAKAAESPEVRAQIGEPIQPAWLIAGDLHVSGSSGNANLSIPISGPRNRGKIRAVAFKSGGVWRFTFLQVNVEGQAGCIDLLSVRPPAERDF
jgi:hypothetical protein